MRPNITIVDIGGGNLGAVRSAFSRLGAQTITSADPDLIAKAERVVLPGVGHAEPVMNHLNSTGIAEVLQTFERPLLGVCLGMQLMYQSLDEGDICGLGLLPGRVKKLQPAAGFRVPNMGWCQLHADRSHPISNGLRGGDYAYFVHSFAADVDQHTILSAQASKPITALAAFENRVGAQFHPERSGPVGQKILENFLC